MADLRNYPAPTFPIQLGQSQIGYRVSSFSVTNYTDAILYLSRTVVNPTATQADAVVPPRTTQGIFGWYADTLYVGSNGALILSTDTVMLQLSAEETGPFVASAIPITSSLIKSVQYGTITSTGLVLTGTSASKTAAITPVTPTKAMVVNLGTSSLTNGVTGGIMCQLALTSPAVVTATWFNGLSGDAGLTVGFCVVEFF